MTNAAITIRPGEALAVMPPNWLELKQEEVSQGQRALAALTQIGASKAKLARLRGRINFAKRWLSIVEKGFVPIPRLEISQSFRGDAAPGDLYSGYGEFSVYLDAMPVKALEVIAAVKAQGIFDRIGLVAPSHRRDPLLVGIIKRNGNPGEERVYSEEANYLITWWDPALLPASEMF